MDGIALPLLTDTLAIGELARRALIARHRVPSATFSGKDPDGRRIEGHRHAFYLPTDEDGDGRLDHLTIFARGIGARGFTRSELAAMEGFRVLRQPGGRPDLRLLPLGIGEPADFDAPVVATSRDWRSATPFVPPRHRKDRGRNRGWGTPTDQLIEELARRGLPAPEVIEPLDGCPLNGRHLRWIEFRRERIFGMGSRGGTMGSGFRIRFAEPVTGPLALGYGCHFGLGLFVRDDQAASDGLRPTRVP